MLTASIANGFLFPLAYHSLRVVANLLLTNAEFRLFLDDLATVGRQIFSDTSFALSEASQAVGDQVKPSQKELDAAHSTDVEEGRAPSSDEVRMKAARVAGVASNGAARAGQKAAESAKEHLSREQSEVLYYRLRQAILKLQERPDYSDSIAGLKELVQRYARIYSSAAEETATVAQEEIYGNEDLRQTVRQFWALLQSFGDPREWEKLEQKFNGLMTHADKDPEFQRLLSEIGNSLQEMLTDPKSLESTPEKVNELTEKSKQKTAESGLRQDADDFLAQAKRTLQTVSEDPAVSKMVNSSKKLYKDAWDAYYDRESSVPADVAHIIIPRLIRAVQHIPIPRLEISSREMDLLVENLILEPGHAINCSSFLPYRVHVTTRNDIDVLKKHSKRVQTDIKTTFTATVLGLNVSASDFGYWVNAHAGLFFRFKDEGIASFHLDERGVDISMDVEVARDRLEQIFVLRGVRVRIHKLDYQLRQSKHRFLLWLLKPFLKQLVRRVLEKQIAERIVSAAAVLNRELVFARERLRAARVAKPPDMATFVRAVLARGTGFGGGDADGIFKGIYTPGSIVKVWHEEAERTEQEVRQGEESNERGKTWRNAIFDVTAIQI